MQFVGSLIRIELYTTCNPNARAILMRKWMDYVITWTLNRIFWDRSIGGTRLVSCSHDRAKNMFDLWRIKINPRKISRDTFGNSNIGIHMIIEWKKWGKKTNNNKCYSNISNWNWQLVRVRSYRTRPSVHDRRNLNLFLCKNIDNVRDSRE